MRCKVVCTFKLAAEDSHQLSFACVYTGSEENKNFFRYTPGGQINLNIVKKEVSEQFEVGKEYYIDFTPAT